MKNYNLSKIMTRAHELRTSENRTMSDALTRAWVEAKIEKLEDIKFMLRMKDRWDRADYAEKDQLNAQIRELNNKLNPVEVKAAPIVEHKYTTVNFDTPKYTGRNAFENMSPELREALRKAFTRCA